MNQHHGMKGLSGLQKLCEPGVQRSDRFGRLFGDLPPLYSDPAALAAIGVANGPMQQPGAAKKTQTVAVGQVFFGQFIDHDLTLDLTSSFERLNDASGTSNFRTPTLDLDCIYGDGPEGSPFLYFNFPSTDPRHVFNGVKLLTGAEEAGATAEQQQDLLRNAHGTAIIGDPRNDENRIISQLQLAVIRAHNAVVDDLAGRPDAPHELFEEAQRILRWLYQWVILHDFLPAMAGQALIDELLGSGRKVYLPDCQNGDSPEPFIPVEFSVAAYRFGHSMIPQRIQIQPGNPAVDVFGPTLGNGFGPLPSLDAVVDWPQVLDLTNPTVDRADQLDIELAKDLLALPFITDPNVEKSLATRNLLRGQAFRLPSGEQIAERCGRDAAEIASVTQRVTALAASATPTVTLNAGTPLWLYLLAEAQVVGRETQAGQFNQGEGLGPVGARIVAEALVGIMELDDSAFLGRDRSWTPAAAGFSQVTDLQSLLAL